jgi:hypothetical protein
MLEASANSEASGFWDAGGAENHKFRGETFAERSALATKLSPLFRMLKVWGLYFESDADKTAQMRAQRKLKKKCGTSRNGTKAYSTFILVILWLNALRLVSAFSERDEFGTSLINKLATISFFFQSAVKCTAYHVASRRGHVNTLLRRLRVSTDFLGVVRKLTVGQIVFNAQCNVMFSGFFLYAVLFDSSKYFWFLCAPVVAEVQMSVTWLYTMKLTCYLVTLLAIQAYFWPATMDQVLTDILIKQFQLVNKRFRTCCSRQGHFNESLKTFRHRHQDLCRAVRTADSFFMVTNVSCCCQIFTVIIVLYALTFIEIENGALGNVYLLLLFTNIFGLIVTTYNGTLINHSVRIFLGFFIHLF